MFRDAHPLEVALLFSVTGILFGVWFFAKILAPPGGIDKGTIDIFQATPEQLHGINLNEIEPKNEAPQLSRPSGIDTAG